MTNLQHPTRDLLERWLEEIHVENYHCGHCEGLHISALHALDGTVNSRIYLEESVLFFSTSFEVRPTALLPLSAELGRLNMDYPTLKLFLDVVDDATPQLVASACMLTSSRITADQFAEFVVITLDGTRLLAEECLQLDYLFTEADQLQAEEGSRSLH
jgi:copper chaperone CopZ